MQKEKVIVQWAGDSKEALKKFPKSIKEHFGADLRRLQLGKMPFRSRPMTSIGKKVFELKEQDSAGWYRLIYVTKIKNEIWVLHCFKKQSRKTSKKDLLIAEKRLKEVRK